MTYSYLPDLPPETPNIWAVCDGFHPDTYGNYASGWYAAALTTNTIADQPFQRGFAYKTAAGTPGALLACSAAAGTDYIYVWNGSTWNDRTGTAATLQNYTNGVQVGNITLIGGHTTSIYFRDATTTDNFAAVTGGPTTGHNVLMVGALNIVMSLNGSGWATSDTNAPTVWNSGEAASGNIWSMPGIFTAGVPLGNDFICFKERGIYRATYVGGNVKWLFTLIDTEKGAWGPRSVVVADGKVVFIGRDGVHTFDGANFRRVDFGIWRTLVDTFGKKAGSDSDYDEVAVIWDELSRRVFFFQVGTTGAGTASAISKFFTYNVASDKWGYQSRLTDAGTGDFYAVFDVSALNDYSTSSFGPTYKTNIGFFAGLDDGLKVLHTTFNASDVPGTNYKPTIRTSRVGSHGRMTRITRVIPMWTKSDGVGSSLSTATVKTMTPYTSDSPMESETAGSDVTLSTDLYRADYNHTHRYQSFEFKINAEAVIAGVELEAKDAGRD